MHLCSKMLWFKTQLLFFNFCSIQSRHEMSKQLCEKYTIAISGTSRILQLSFSFFKPNCKNFCRPKAWIQFLSAQNSPLFKFIKTVGDGLAFVALARSERVKKFLEKYLSPGSMTKILTYLFYKQKKGSEWRLSLIVTRNNL